MHDREHTHMLKKTVTLMSIPSQSSDSLHWAFSCGSCCLCLHLWFERSLSRLFYLQTLQDSFSDGRLEDSQIPAHVGSPSL